MRGHQEQPNVYPSSKARAGRNIFSTKLGPSSIIVLTFYQVPSGQTPTLNPLFPLFAKNKESCGWIAQVYSFPGGRLMTGAPLTKSAVLRGAYGDSAKRGVLKRGTFCLLDLSTY